MIGKQTEERKWFTLEERKAIHKANYGICACCGKKLTVKSMTIEHIIPLLRGGTNTVPFGTNRVIHRCRIIWPIGFRVSKRNLMSNDIH